MLFKLKATAFAIRLSLNSIHPSVNNFLPLPPYFFLFFLTAVSTKRGKQYSVRQNIQNVRIVRLKVRGTHILNIRHKEVMSGVSIS